MLSQERVRDERKLWAELKARVDKRVSSERSTFLSHISHYGKAVLLMFGLLLAYWGILSSHTFLASSLSWSLTGVFSFLLVVNVAHDASHGVYFQKKCLNRLSTLFAFALLGVDGELWALRHRLAHHPHTNISEQDPDSQPNFFLRLSPHHPWRWWFRYQHRYAPLLYCFAFLHTALVQDIEHLFWRPIPYVQKIASLRFARIRMFLVKLFTLTLFGVFPMLIAEKFLAYILLGMVIQSITASVIFVATICLNHYVLETTFYGPEAIRENHFHFFHQLRSSADWSPSSRFICWIMGGANVHISHHLFPSVSHRYSYQVTQEIRAFCSQHQLPYQSFTFCEGTRSHFRFLKALGAQPQVGI